MDGIGTDEQSIIDIICSCNSEQRSDLKKSFKKVTKDDLMLVMREELADNFLELAICLMREPLAFDIDLINIFLKVSKILDLIDLKFRMNFIKFTFFTSTYKKN